MLHQELDDTLDSLLKSLVSIETENPPGNEKACAEYIQQWFHDRDIDAQLVEKPDADRPQVVAEVGDSDPTVVFNGHIDVVPAGNQDEWNSDPYDPVRKDGKLYGRGSVDMKAGVAVAMIVMAELKDTFDARSTGGRIRFHAAMGEETGEPGTKTLLDEGFGGDYGIVLEPTGLRTAVKTKGTAWYEITVSGEPSHASRPYQGTNAIVNAQPLYERLLEFGQEIQEREDPLLGSAYATITQVNAGTKENVLPESATFVVDRRILPSEDFDSVHEELGSLIADVSNTHDLKIDWDVMQTYKPSETPADSELAEVFRSHSHRVAGVPPEEWGIPAATDTRNFINDAGIEAITWGPGDIQQAHTFNEYIELEEVAASVDILERATTELLGVESDES